MYNASLVSDRLLRVLKPAGLQGCVHSIFKNTVNIEGEDDFLFTLQGEEVPVNPRSVVLPIESWLDVRSVLDTVGIAVELTKSGLTIPSRQLRISFKEAEIWDASPSIPGTLLPFDQLEQNLEIFASFLAQWEYSDFYSGDIEHLLRNRLSEASYELSTAIGSGRFFEVRLLADKLIGLGPGLTPSGDDILSGIMASGVYLGLVSTELRPHVMEMNAAIVKRLRGRTNRISFNFLMDASRGEVYRPAKELIGNILCSTKRDNLFSLAGVMMGIGSTSGRDMLEGILIGLGAFIQFRNFMHPNEALSV
jgi:hypothetical protein